MSRCIWANSSGADLVFFGMMALPVLGKDFCGPAAGTAVQTGKGWGLGATGVSAGNRNLEFPRPAPKPTLGLMLRPRRPVRSLRRTQSPPQASRGPSPAH